MNCPRHLTYSPSCQYCIRKRKIEEGLRNIKDKEVKTGPPITRDQYVANELRLKANLFEARNEEYGNSYKDFGKVMAALFDEKSAGGILLKGERDHARWGILIQIVGKLHRYANNFAGGGHADSLDDISVYAMMLKELDDVS